MKSNSVTMFIVLLVCIYLLAFKQGKKIYGYAIRSVLEYDVVGIVLVDMYGKRRVKDIA